MQVQNRKAKCDLTMTGRETIHSGQFMVSHFEAEEQDDDEHSLVLEPARKVVVEGVKPQNIEISKTREKCSPQIDSSLAKLFQCMSLAYRQKLTSPKWNRFKGIRLRWKDKIRLNNVIWRCWHMQFILKQNSLVCQFASPLDVDTHNKPEAVVLEGKYWKRKLAAVTAEYKKWRMFSRNRILGYGTKDSSDLPDIEFMEWGMPSMLVDDDYMQLMSDTLFSTISNQVFAFPDSREIARGAGLADFIQPSLGPLQPNLDDYMDTLQPLHDLLEAKLAPVVEEISMDTNTNNNMGTTDSYLNNYDTANMESANYSISNYLGNTSIIAPERTSINRTKSLSNVFLSMRGENSHAPANYSMYPLPNVSTQKLQNQSIFSNQNVINQAQITSVDTNMNVQPINPVSLSNLSNIQGSMNMNNLNMHSDFTSPSTVTGEQRTPKIVSSSLASSPNKEIKQKAPSMRLSTATHQHPMNAVPNSSINLPFYRIGANQQSCKPRNNTSECNKNVNNKKQSAKEMFRSNSLPLNSTLNLQEELLGSARSNVKHNIPLHGSRDKLSTAYSSVTDSSIRPSNVLLAQLLTNKQSSASSSNIASNIVNTQPSPRFTDESSILISTIPSSNQFMPSLSPQSPDLVPTSPDGSVSPPTGKNSRFPPREIRRVGHTHAEQKRRYNIKNGFDVLHSLIPYLQQNPTNKLSKAAMLHKGAEYIKQLQIERKSLEDEIISLKTQAESLNISISNSQSKLPATGAPVSRRKTGRICEMFREYIHARTLEDWKFWIFSLLVEPLLFTFNSSVSTINMQELCRTTMHWVDQHCSLVDLRPGVLNALRLVCTTTDILSHPERLPEQARNAVVNQYQQY